MRDFIKIVESEQFKNELDHEITLDVSEKEIEGVPGVMIYIAGPDSDTENHITRVEAQHLLKQLEDVLGEKKRTDESVAGGKLGDFVSVKLNDPEADFWIVRRGSVETVGSPTKDFNPEHYGITVTSKALLPQYLFYALQHVHMQGYFKPLARGSIKLVGIRADDIKSIRLG